MFQFTNYTRYNTKCTVDVQYIRQPGIGTLIGDLNAKQTVT